MSSSFHLLLTRASIISQALDRRLLLQVSYDIGKVRVIKLRDGDEETTWTEGRIANLFVFTLHLNQQTYIKF